MFDFALLAVGGADEADRITPVGLNFEVKPGRVALDGYYLRQNTLGSQGQKVSNVWLQMK
jgi:hypothetical protein